MSRTYVCDKCGKTINQDFGYLRAVKETRFKLSYGYGKEKNCYDLCSECAKELWKWMKENVNA